MPQQFCLSAICILWKLQSNRSQIQTIRSVGQIVLFTNLDLILHRSMMEYGSLCQFDWGTKGWRQGNN